MISFGVFSMEENMIFLVSQRLKSTCIESIQEEDQNPLHKQWGGVCDQDFSMSMFIGLYTVTTYNTIQCTTK